MVWAGVSGNFKTDLVVINGTLTGQRYIDQVIHSFEEIWNAIAVS